MAQTAFVDFNIAGEYTNNFNPWNDNGSGVNAGNYSFAESASDGVGGSGGVAVFANNNMTATYNAGSWDLSTNGATAMASVMVYADGEASGDKLQLGFINTDTNGLDNNSGVAYESFSFAPTSATKWPVHEQYRTNNTTINRTTAGAVTVAIGHWYKFIVAVTNTSGASGNISAGCALVDYGPSGLSPGSNLITFSTAASQAAQNFATNTAVWPALYAVQDAGVGAWDNFLVYTARSLPIFTYPLTNLIALINSTATFTALADGPGAISYAWYTNGVLVSGASGYSCQISALSPGLTNVAVVAGNANGSTTNQASITVITPMTPLALTGFNLDVVVESNAVGSALHGLRGGIQSGAGNLFLPAGLAGHDLRFAGVGSFQQRHRLDSISVRVVRDQQRFGNEQ